MTITVRPPTADELDEVQLVFNHKSVIAALGGLTMRDVMRDKIKRQLGLWGAWVSPSVPGAPAVCVGATMVAGRSQCHLLKYGSVGVVEDFRRQRIGTALYVAMTAQGLLEGRRLYEDTIVGDNLVQFTALPRLGILQAGELRHRTASAKSICLFQASLLDAGQWELMLARLPVNLTIEVRENSFTDDLWAKNMELAASHAMTSGLPARMAQWRDRLREDTRFRVLRGDDFAKPHKPKPAGMADGVPASEHRSKP